MNKLTHIRWLKFRVWLLEVLHIHDLHITLFWAGVIGFTGGMTSIAFRDGIHYVQWLFTHHQEDLVETATELSLMGRLLVPTLGGLLAGLVMQYGMRLLPGQSATDYMEAICLGDGVIRARSSLVKSTSSLLSIASGGSIGKEGSMVQLSAMMASILGRRAGFSTPTLRLMVACGSAAGIASAYNAPIAGALFIAEIALGSISMQSFGPLVFSSVIATVTVRQVMGAKPIFEIPHFQLVSNWELIPHLALGILAGFSAPLFLKLLNQSKHLFSKIKGPLYLRMMIGGLIVGVISVQHPDVWGNGYTVVDSILHSDWAWQMLIGILFFKLIATLATVGSGAVGGVFTPTLFVGAVMGCIVGYPLHYYFPNYTAPPNAYALVGMGCFLAGTTHAPLMAMLMLFEMTLDYDIVLPLMLACVASYYTSQSINRKSIYSESVGEKNIITSETLRSRQVKEIVKPNPVHVGLTARAAEIARAFTKHRYNFLYVTNPDGRFCGAISLHDIKTYLNDPEFTEADVILALDILEDNFPVLTPDTELKDALQKFSAHGGERIPVVDNLRDRKLVGSVSKSDLLLTLAHGTDDNQKS